MYNYLLLVLYFVPLSCYAQLDSSGCSNVPNFFYKCGTDYGDNIMYTNDDGGIYMNISVAFPFFDEYHSGLYINTNGVISFLEQVSQFTPNSFPLDGNRRLVAPFWADVDTRKNDGRVYWRETTDRDLLSRISYYVRQQFVEHRRFRAVWALVVTWHEVTYYGGSNSTSLNTFQATIATNGRHSFAIFHYGDITWTYGTASHSIPAQAGFNAGDGKRFFSIPGSRTPAIVDIETTGSSPSNPGRWIFQIDSKNVVNRGCNVHGSVVLGPRFGNVFGGKKILISGPCFSSARHDIICRFGNILVHGTIESETIASCVTPYRLQAGRTRFALSLNRGSTYNHTADFWYVEDEAEDYTVRQESLGSWYSKDLTQKLVISWNADSLESERVSVEFISYKRDNFGVIYNFSTILANDIPNSGSFQLSNRLEHAESLQMATFGTIRVKEIGTDEYRQQSVWSKLRRAPWFTNLYLYETAIRVPQNGGRGDLALRGYPWDTITEWGEQTTRSESIERALMDITHTMYDHVCMEWQDNELRKNLDFDDVPASPCTMNQALNDPSFVADDYCNRNEECYVRPKVHHCVRSARPSLSGSGQQACYGRDGGLLSFDQGGGTYTRSHIAGHGPTRKVMLLDHFIDDIEPHAYCCHLTRNCELYRTVRPTDDCSRYAPPRIARSAGDPHVTTLDGLEYTFNGVGEFHLMTSSDPSAMQLQARSSAYMRDDIPGDPVRDRTPPLGIPPRLFVPRNHSGEITGDTGEEETGRGDITDYDYVPPPVSYDYVLPPPVSDSYGDNPDGSSSAASVWTAVAMSRNQSSVIQVQTGQRLGEEEIEVLADGEVIDFDERATWTYDGVSVTRFQDSVTVSVQFDDNSQVKIKQVEHSLGLLVIPAKSYTSLSDPPKGLLGIYNGDMDDDLTLYNGTKLETNASLHQIHTFGLTWRTTANDSLFTYPSGMSHEDFQDYTFEPALELPDSNDTRVQEICGDDWQCKFDLIITGNEALAAETRKGNENFENIVQAFEGRVNSAGFVKMDHMTLLLIIAGLFGLLK